ncbi:probable 39S ribosomal protein L45, mitochondrial isoform X2 [Thrips palmi]|uniref:Large ribosomal subunit protein mL45 n=1 Tax=Thrips palmi TaxID=161013 RepID=A0A6P8YBG5_THRPL|nr:probable 39S ribosomal protein L45, mitochondrial isoform X2 [Thrips palmi]
MMALRLVSQQAVAGLMKRPTRGALGSVYGSHEQVRTVVNNKHKDPKFKNLRRLKVTTQMPMKYTNNVELAIRDGFIQNIPNLKKLWRERDMSITGSSTLAEEFVPPENQGLAITEEVKKKWNNIGSFGKDKLAVRKIRQFETEFNLKAFLGEAQETYIKAHECLAERSNWENLNDYVTEYARVAMLMNASQRTIRWKFLESLEEPKAVQVRCFKLDEDLSMFAQITVRFHSQQCLAVYDRFGRLLYGSEVLAKDVLEYVVFEKHLSNEYGVWRVHAKLIPQARIRMAEQTFVAPKEEPQETSSVVTEPAPEAVAANTN